MKRAFLALLLAGLLCGCGADLRQEETAAYTLGVVLKTMDAEHWLEIGAGMSRAAGELDVRLILQYPSDELAAEEQKTILRDMLEAPIDALLFAPCDSDDTAWLAAEAEAAGLPLFTVDTGANDSKLPYIGSNNREIGHMVYDHLLDALGAGGRVGIITGTTRQNSLSDRVSGLRFYCARDGLLEVAALDTNCNNYADAYRAAYRQIQEEAVSAIFCTSGVIGMGAVSAREELERYDVLLIAVDSQDDVLNAVREGRLDALVAQPGYEIGYQAVCDVVASLSGEAPTFPHYITNTLLTADNIDAFSAQTEGEAE